VDLTDDDAEVEPVSVRWRGRIYVLDESDEDSDQDDLDDAEPVVSVTEKYRGEPVSVTSVPIRKSIMPVPWLRAPGSHPAAAGGGGGGGGGGVTPYRSVDPPTKSGGRTWGLGLPKGR